MLTSLFQAVCDWLKDIFVWAVKAGATRIWNFLVQLWDRVTEVSGSFYFQFVEWVAGLICRLVPDLPNDQNTIEEFVERVNAWDQIFPIHETFNICSIIVSYLISKLVLKILLFALKLFRKFMPF